MATRGTLHFHREDTVLVRPTTKWLTPSRHFYNIYIPKLALESPLWKFLLSIVLYIFSLQRGKRWQLLIAIAEQSQTSRVSTFTSDTTIVKVTEVWVRTLLLLFSNHTILISDRSSIITNWQTEHSIYFKSMHRIHCGPFWWRQGHWKGTTCGQFWWTAQIYL